MKHIELVAIIGVDDSVKDMDKIILDIHDKFLNLSLDNYYLEGLSVEEIEGE